MVYHFLFPLSKYFFAFNVTRYITFRGGCAVVTAFLLVFLFWRFTIARLQRLKVVEKIDMYGHIHLETLHGTKKGTPTMGGLLILFAVLGSTLLWARLDNVYIWLCMGIAGFLGILGFTDDYLKLKKGKGLTRIQKFSGQIAVGVAVGIVAVASKYISTTWHFPFAKDVILDLGYFYLFWAALMIVASSNAVNFTDGLDGLAIGAIVINALFFALLAYLSGHANFASYLFIPYIQGTGELTVLCLAVGGAGLAFLWYNSYPAQVFMGDVGALALGGLTGAVALFVKKEFLLFLSGGLFVIEAASVILQILWVRYGKRRLFRAAPLHHHFQLLGWKEPKIIIRFWIVSIVCAVLALLTLKLR
ncbi:MAG: phospho-N-acetylmuramoyl-pentapeptide-transferase [Candidatus Omnitrophica bacterium]|nr:phospho-N-acetylmuramoyl-pentapeptide-transferase [Candidatus Omnitrophota bacterium]